jgi:hypothetical protein
MMPMRQGIVAKKLRLIYNKPSLISDEVMVKLA